MFERKIAVSAVCVALAGPAVQAAVEANDRGPELGSPGIPVIEIHERDRGGAGAASSGSGLVSTPGYPDAPRPGQGPAAEEMPMGGAVPGFPMGFPGAGMWGPGAMPGQPANAPEEGGMWTQGESGGSAAEPLPDQDNPEAAVPMMGYPPGGGWAPGSMPGASGLETGGMPGGEYGAPGMAGQQQSMGYPPASGWGPGSMPGALGYEAGGMPGGDYGAPGMGGQEQTMGYPQGSGWGPGPIPGAQGSDSGGMPGGEYGAQGASGQEPGTGYPSPGAWGQGPMPGELAGGSGEIPSGGYGYGSGMPGQRPPMGFPPGGRWGQAPGWGQAWGADQGQTGGYPPGGAWGPASGGGDAWSESWSSSESWNTGEPPRMDYPGAMMPPRGMQGYGPMPPMMGGNPMRFMEERHREMDERMSRLESLLQQILANQEKLLSGQ